MTFYAKVRRYTGSETVIGIGSYPECVEIVDDYNTRYQTNAAYVEAYDPEKAKDWPNR